MVRQTVARLRAEMNREGTPLRHTEQGEGRKSKHWRWHSPNGTSTHSTQAHRLNGSPC